MCGGIFLLFVIGFRRKPATPPSYAEAQAELEKTDYKSEIKALCLNKSFILLVVSYGVNVG